MTGIAPPSVADDEALVERLASIVNQVYLGTEGDMWNEGFQRTRPEMIRTFIRDRELGVAYAQDTPRSLSVSKGRPIDCFHWHPSPGATAADFGTFALDALYRGTGLGRQILAFAEELFPTDLEHAFEARLSAWDTCSGYELVELASFQDDHPDLTPL